MKSKNIQLPIVIAFTLSACSTIDKSSTSIQSAYHERGIVVNNQGQLEPIDINACKYENYYWRPIGGLNDDTLAHYNALLSGIMLDLIEDDGDVYISSPTSLDNSNTTPILTSLPNLNSEFNEFINTDTHFILNLQALKSKDALQEFADIINDSDNNKNISIIAGPQQTTILKNMLPSDVIIKRQLNDDIHQTDQTLLALCQTLDANSVTQSFLENTEIAQLLLAKSIDVEDLIRALPYDADFSDLTVQETLWEQGLYLAFNGQTKTIVLDNSIYTPLDFNSSIIGRERGSVELQSVITIKMK